MVLVNNSRLSVQPVTRRGMENRLRPGRREEADALKAVDHRGVHPAEHRLSCRRRWCPRSSLHLPHEAVPLWQKTEEELGEIGLPPPFWAFAWAGGQALARYVLDHPQMVRRQERASISRRLGPGRHRCGEGRRRVGAGRRYRPIRLRRGSSSMRELNDVAIDISNEDLLDQRRRPLAMSSSSAISSMRRPWPRGASLAAKARKAARTPKY